MQRWEMDDGVAVSISQLTFFSVQGWFDVTSATDATVSRSTWGCHGSCAKPLSMSRNTRWVSVGQFLLTNVQVTTYIKLQC